VDRRGVTALLAVLAAVTRIGAASGASAGVLSAGAAAIPPPGPRDLCPICGMLVAKYPAWVAAIRFRTGEVHYFDGAKDLFKYLVDLPRRAPGRRRADVTDILVTEFYDLRRIDATQAYFVIGSDVLGPMGHELVPLASRADAAEFLRDHQGRRILQAGEVTADLLARLDRGLFD
jgi:nitrous oxide reductase accessory protein NosL